jgi:putative transposase
MNILRSEELYCEYDLTGRRECAVSDTVSSGRRFRCLTVIDEFSRESLAIHVAHPIPAVRVIEVLERLRDERGLPAVIVTDNGSEFTSRAFDAWAYAREIRIDCTRFRFTGQPSLRRLT